MPEAETERPFQKLHVRPSSIFISAKIRCAVLYALRDSRSAFILSLQSYSDAVDRRSSEVALDYERNDVGIKADKMNTNLSEMIFDFRRLGAAMSIQNPELERDMGLFAICMGRPA